MNGRNWIVRASVALFLATAAAIWLSSSGTLGGFTAARATNGTNTARLASLSIANSLGGSGCTATASGATTPTTCTGSLYPSSAGATATAGATNTVTNTGTTPADATTARYRVPGCGPVSLANTGTSASNGVLLPRVGTTFAPTDGPVSGGGSITLNGSTGYAAAVGQANEPTISGLLSTASYGLGIWFRTTNSTTATPLFGLSSAATAATSTSSNRVLYLDAAGRISFLPTANGTPTVSLPASPAAGYNDGTWHFAYVLFAGGGLGYSTSVFVDGSKLGSWDGAFLGSIPAASGYWTAGWAASGAGAGYFRGSLAGFLVDDSGSAPKTFTGRPTTYGFDATATQLWTMSDSGGSYDGTTVAGIYTGTAYPNSAANPCSSVLVTWTLANPAGSVASGATLASLSTAVTVAAPGPGVAQTSTILLSRAGGLNSYLVGLIVYAPIVSTYSVGTNWQVAFSWNTPAAGPATGSTFVLA